LCGKERGKKIIGSLKRGKSAQVGGIDSVGIVLPNTGIPPHYDDTSMIQL
jgi:hypothetical protein